MYKHLRVTHVVNRKYKTKNSLYSYRYINVYNMHPTHSIYSPYTAYIHFDNCTSESIRFITTTYNTYTKRINLYVPNQNPKIAVRSKTNTKKRKDS